MITTRALVTETRVFLREIEAKPEWSTANHTTQGST